MRFPRTLYRRHKGWDGKIYHVPVRPPELRDLIFTWLLYGAALLLLLTTAAFFIGFYVRWL